MTVQKIQRSFYSIPAGLPFARILAKSLLDQTIKSPEQLGDITILLPTRRACRTLQESFLRETNGNPILLPQIQPLGDIDEQDLSLSLVNPNAIEEIFNLPPAISALQRQILLAKLILARSDGPNSYEPALTLAETLGQFLDQIIIEGLNFADLEHIVPEAFADHWQITLDFLKIIGEFWPKILDEHGMIDASSRRNKLMDLLTKHWEQTRPDKTIFAAGSTGSIPATARLLDVISYLPNGQVILPGFDTHIDKESWAEMEPTHSQYGFKQLLNSINAEPSSILDYPYSLNEQTPRIALAREIMRPGATTDKWQNLKTQNTNNVRDFEKAFQNLEVCVCDTMDQEAATIALKFRETLESPKKTAALITPDRMLARRVSAYCRRWSIEVDDSAGSPLEKTLGGRFVLLLINCIKDRFKAVSFASLLKHPLCHFDLSSIEKNNLIQAIESKALRGLSQQITLSSLLESLSQLTKQEQDNAKQLWDPLEPIINLDLFDKRNFSDFNKLFLNCLENLSSTDKRHGSEILWQGEEGESLVDFFYNLNEHDKTIGFISLTNYIEIIRTLLAGKTFRARYGVHPRLMILGQLEARMIDADEVILGGLNEGIWPSDQGHDPWMSRPMRATFGLPDIDRFTGLSAHDFEQGLCTKSVLLTRSVTRDGTPTVPARWLQRLDTVMDALGVDRSTVYSKRYQNWFDRIDQSENTQPISRPTPKPPVHKRPKKLSVTKIELWMLDPYSIYASHVLKLRKLDELEKKIDHAEKGTIIHKALENFTHDHPQDMPEQSQEILRNYIEAEIEVFSQQHYDWSYWLTRFDKSIDWFVHQERDWRSNATVEKIEARGEIKITTLLGNELTLSGIADRIDHFGGANHAIIDYKSGGSFTKTKIKNGELPQLGLEAFILSEQGFADIHGNVSYLGYWVLNGGNPAGKITKITEQAEIETMTQNSKEGLHRFIDCFSHPQTPYHCIPYSGKQPRYSDFAHLARIKEWSIEDESDQEAA